MHRYPAEEAFRMAALIPRLHLGIIQIAFAAFSNIARGYSRPIEREAHGGQDAFVIN